MKKLLLSLGILLIINCGAFGQERRWEIFSPVTNDWSILSPGPLRPDDEAAKPKSKKGEYKYKDSEGFFAVAYLDLPRVPKKLQDYYEKNRDSAVKGVNGRLLKEEQFINKGITGRELHIKLEYNVERVRMFFYGKRFYIIIAVLPDDQIDSDEINAYMNSFTVKGAQ